MWDGKRRFGNPRTDEERRRRHKKLYGTSELPPRGAGLNEVIRQAKISEGAIRTDGWILPKSKKKLAQLRKKRRA